jgi:hypothetical protein
VDPRDRKELHPYMVPLTKDPGSYFLFYFLFSDTAPPYMVPLTKDPGSFLFIYFTFYFPILHPPTWYLSLRTTGIMYMYRERRRETERERERHQHGHEIKKNKPCCADKKI